MNKLQTIREAVIKANPEIVELKYGCLARDRHGDIWGYSPQHGWVGITVSGWTSVEPNTVLGRPIRLADVVFTYRDEDNPYWEEFQVDVVDKWNLHKDSLEAQSEETINFLYDLLK